MLSKKSQMEIIGVVIIVLLLSLGIVFVLKFVYKGNEVDIRQEYLESQMAANMLNAIIQINLPNCSNQQVKTLIRDCALNNEIKCDGDVHSCTFLNNTISEILNNTLKKWHKRYKFKANVEASSNSDGFSGNIEIGQECQFYDSKYYPIAAGSKTVNVELRICKGYN